MLRRSLLLLSLLLTLEPAAVFAQPGRAVGPDAGGAVCGLAFMGVMTIIWLCIAIWVFNDAGGYGMNQFLWALLVFFTGFIGLIVYIVVRSNVISANNRPRSRPKRRVRRYDEDDERRRDPYDDDNDRRPRKRPRRRTDEDDDDEPDSSRRRREQWERDADY